MLDGIEVFAYVALQHPAVNAVFAVEAAHELFQPIKPEMRSFSHLRRVVVFDERRRDARLQNVVAKCMLHYLVFVAVRHNNAFFWFVHLERVVWRKPVRFAFQLFA